VALPDLGQRIRMLLATYQQAGGRDACICSMPRMPAQ
jgi:hypothetical protein